MIVNDMPIWDDDISEKLTQIRDFMPLALEKPTWDYINNLFSSGYPYNDFFNNLYLNMYQVYIFFLHAFLVRVYKFYTNDQSLLILQKTKAIAKNSKELLKLESLRHNTFNMIEKDTRIHLFNLLDIDESKGSTFTDIPNGIYTDCVTGDSITVTDGTLTAECTGKGNARIYVLNGPGKIGEDGVYLQ